MKLPRLQEVPASLKMKTNIGSILKTSVPIVVDLAAQVIMWAIEMTLVSRISVGVMSRFYPGAGARGLDAVTAVGNVGSIVMWTFTVLLIFIFGTTIIINKLIGEGKKSEADHFLGQALFTTVIPAIAIAVLWNVFAPFIFKTILGTPAAVAAIGVDYLKTISPFAPFVIMNFVAIGIVRGAGDTHLAMITGLMVNAIHLVLAVLLVFGFSVFPTLGVRGAAIAAGIGHTAGCVFTFSVILRGKSVLTFNWSDFTGIRGKSIGSVLSTGTPITLEQLAWMTGIVIILGFTNRLGPVAAAAHVIILTFQRLFSILYQAFAMGALTLVGRRYGANEHHYARQTTVMFFWLVGSVVLFLACILFLRARYFVLIFTSDPDVVPLCTRVFKLVAFIQIPKALSFVYSYSLRGVGENRFPMYLAIFGVLVFEVILGFNLAFTAGLSILGIWIAAGIDEVFRVSLGAWRFHWKLRRLTTGAGETA
jgi:putative MATE family efflux protein